EERRVPGRPLRRDPMGPGLSRRGLVLHQPLDVDRPLRLCRRPSHRKLQRAVVRRPCGRRLSLRHHLWRAHALRGDPGAKLSHAGLQRGRPQRRRVFALVLIPPSDPYPPPNWGAPPPPPAAPPPGPPPPPRAGGLGAPLGKPTPPFPR